MAGQKSQVFRTILLLATICLFSFPAYAKYSGGTGEPNDPYLIATDQEIIWGNCDPNQWGPLAPPSGHWVFSEPLSVQTKLVTIEATILDADNKPLSNADVLAYCEPWYFITGGRTDALGQCQVVGPIGDYRFYAAASEILAASNRVAIFSDADVALEGTTPKQITFVHPDGSPLGPPREEGGWCWFTPTNLPSPVGPLSSNFFSLQNGQVSWLTTPEVCGVLTLLSCPGDPTPGYIVFNDFPSNPATTFVVDDEHLGHIRFQLDGLPTCETWWNFFFEPVSSEIGGHWVWAPRVSSAGGIYEIRVTPGLYRVSAQVCRATDWAYPASWVPIVVRAEHNSVRELHLGGTFEAHFNVIRWDPGYIHLWIDIVDNLGNYLADVHGVASLKLKRGDEVLFDGPITGANGRYIGFGNPLADGMRLGAPVEFEYQFSSPVLGEFATSGLLPRDRSIHLDNPLVGQSSHFDLHSRDPAPYAQEILQLIECAYDWLVHEYSGPFSPQTGERFDLLYETAGGGGSSGDEFGIDLYSGSYMTGDTKQTGILYHEFAHTCLFSMFAQHWPQGIRQSIHELSEPQANVIGMYLARAIHGERAFRMHYQFRSNQFFSAQAIGSFVDEVDRYIFPWLYIDARYGQAVNRDFFRAMYTNEHNLGAILETIDFLKTESERTATLYSYLANDNLAWLYRWAGFEVSDEIVDQGVAYINTQVGQ